MYYYIFEPSSTNEKIGNLEDKIKDYLAEMDIVGEMASPSHARSVDYLITQAITKKYSTVVAVGNIQHITTVAGKLIGSNTVLGIIPTGVFPDLNNLLNITNWQEAAQALKHRRYIEIKLAQIEPGSHIFLTSCQIIIKPPSIGSIYFSKYKVNSLSGRITVKINPEDNSLIFETFYEKKRSLLELFSRLNKDKPNPYLSSFKETKGQIITEPPAPLTVDGALITETPVTVSLHPKEIKLIVSKASGA